MSLINRDKQVIWHPYSQSYDKIIPIVKGKGAYLYDDENNKFIDIIGSWWVSIHGHSHHYIAKAVAKQIKKLDHVIFANFTHKGAVELAERLLSHLPGQHRVFFSDNGSTAVEVAVKMAIQFWANQNKHRHTIIAFQNSYHGDTFGAMSVSERSTFTQPFFKHLFKTKHIPLPTNDNISIIKQQLEKLIKKELPAAFIFEPLVQGAGGMNMYDAKLLDELLLLCKQHNIITIADEVMTGFGRTGKYFASDYLKNKPDIYCLSKGLTGGTMALGVTTSTETIFKAFESSDRNKTFFHGHSFTANPIAISAALASLDILEKENTWNSINRINKQHKIFEKKLKKYNIIKNIRICGVIMAFDIVTKNKKEYLNPMRQQIFDFFYKRHILIRPLGNVIYLIPPYCLQNKDLKTVQNTIIKFIEKIA